MKVDASTTTAAQLYSTSVFAIPDFQREYSWGPDGEVFDFWTDLRGSIDNPPYFLGLLIVTEERGRKVVVDGQQRLTTLTLLANAIRKAALTHGKALIADSMRDVFLFHLDYETEERTPRIEATAGRDKATLDFLLHPDGPRPADASARMVEAQRDLDTFLATDLAESDPGTRLAKWARFVSSGVTFALFEHPDRNAAYKVYEVVNTRGRDLTPAELIKSYLIGSVSEDQQREVYERWSTLESSFTEVRAESQFTQFVRHIVTLTRGYVLPRDLYEEITKVYMGGVGVDQLLCELEEHLPIYLQMVDPSNDRERTDDAPLNAFSVLDTLGLRTVRPIFQASAESENPTEALTALLRIVVPRLAMGTFGTGSVERRFADDARRIHEGASWAAVMEGLHEDLAPNVRSFRERILEAPMSKGLASIIRHSVLQGTVMPALGGYPHLVRPRNAENWPGFSDADFKRVGGTVGNTILLVQERRPRNTNTFEGALERLFPLQHECEATTPEFNDPAAFTPLEVEVQNERFANAAADLWYVG